MVWNNPEAISDFLFKKDNKSTFIQNVHEEIDYGGENVRRQQAAVLCQLKDFWSKVLTPKKHLLKLNCCYWVFYFNLYAKKNNYRGDFEWSLK